MAGVAAPAVSTSLICEPPDDAVSPYAMSNLPRPKAEWFLFAVSAAVVAELLHFLMQAL